MYAIGLDLSGQNAEFGIIDNNGRIIGRSKIPMLIYDDVDDFINALVPQLEKLLELAIGKYYRSRICGIGIAAPAGNSRNGCMENSVNIPWAKNARIPLADMLYRRLDIPVALENDAKAATLGEMRFGIAKDMKNFVYLTLRMGVGSGIVSHGKLISGSDGLAGELGHMRVISNGRQCGCGRKGCLETYCSESGIVQTAKEMLGNSDQKSFLRDAPGENLTLLDILKAARRGDQIALDVFSFTGQILGEACAEIATFCSPEAFIFYGGLSYAADFILTPVRQSYYNNVLSIYRGHCRFLVSNVRDHDIGLLGAAAIAMDKYGDEDDDLLLGY